MDWPGEKVLTRVIDALENGVGGALRPWQIRRVEKANADARAQERLLLEQADRNILDMRAGRKKMDATGKLIACDVPQPLLLEGPTEADGGKAEQLAPIVQDFALAAHEAAQTQEMQRAVNLKRIALFAEEEAEEIDDKNAEANQGEGAQPKIDHDWFAKWRAGAQEVSRDEMQRLWGKLLAGEVSHPGSYSLHTVDFLSRMSTADADLIARIVPFSTMAGIVRVSDEFFEDQGLRFSDFLYLDDMGLINGTTGAGGLSYSSNNHDFNGRAGSMIACGNSVLIFDMGDFAASPNKLKLDVYSLTRVGREIISLAAIPASVPYLQAIANKAIEQGAVEVQLGTLHADGRQIIWPRVIATKPPPPPVEG